MAWLYIGFLIIEILNLIMAFSVDIVVVGLFVDIGVTLLLCFLWLVDFDCRVGAVVVVGRNKGVL